MPYIAYKTESVRIPIHLYGSGFKQFNDLDRFNIRFNLLVACTNWFALLHFDVKKWYQDSNENPHK